VVAALLTVLIEVYTRTRNKYELKDDLLTVTELYNNNTNNQQFFTSFS
jgi:hypothetical protein